jgi:hypothetical protein
MSRPPRLRSACAACGVIALGLAGWCSSARASAPVMASGSPLAIPRLADDEPAPTLILAQRAIDRTWGPSEDSIYVETRVREWRSEGLAMALSGALPGAGQLYVGERSGLWFALAEAAGWTAKTMIRNRAVALEDEAKRFVGHPSDSASTWSFERWAGVTNGDVEALRALYLADPDAFFRQIGLDDTFLPGWSGDAAATRATFEQIRERSDVQYGRARIAGMVLWLNHTVAALDALRAARLHNFPIQKNLELKLKSSWRGGGPGFVAILERKF